MSNLEELRKQVNLQRAARAEKQAKQAEEIETVRLTEELKLADLETKHGLLGYSIRAVFAGNTGKMVVVEKPKAMVFQAHEAKQELVASEAGEIKARTNPKDLYELALSCLVYPSRQEFEKIIEESPSIASEAGSAAVLLAKAFNETIEKK